MERKRILVVDDEVEILNVLERFLSKMDTEVEVTDSWEEALHKFDSNHYDLICLDVHMPGRDGFQIAKEMKDKDPNQKIVIITGLSAGDVFRHFKENCVDVNDVLYKPFSFRKVRSVISTVLEL